MLPSIYSKQVTRAINAYNQAVNKHEKHRSRAFNVPTRAQYNRVAKKLKVATRARKVATKAQYQNIVKTLGKLQNARMKTSNVVMYKIYTAQINALRKNLERI
jgi:hypothetical protein